MTVTVVDDGAREGERGRRRRRSLGGRRRKSHDVIIPRSIFRKTRNASGVAGVDGVGKPTSSNGRTPTPEDPDADGDLPSSFRRSRGPELADRSRVSSSSSSACVTGTDSETRAEDNEDDFRVGATEGHSRARQRTMTSTRSWSARSCVWGVHTGDMAYASERE